MAGLVPLKGGQRKDEMSGESNDAKGQGDARTDADGRMPAD